MNPPENFIVARIGTSHKIIMNVSNVFKKQGTLNTENIKIIAINHRSKNINHKESYTSSSLLTQTPKTKPLTPFPPEILRLQTHANPPHHPLHPPNIRPNHPRPRNRPGHASHPLNALHGNLQLRRRSRQLPRPQAPPDIPAAGQSGLRNVAKQDISSDRYVSLHYYPEQQSEETRQKLTMHPSTVQRLGNHKPDPSNPIHAFPLPITHRRIIHRRLYNLSNPAFQDEKGFERCRCG